MRSVKKPVAILFFIATLILTGCAKDEPLSGANPGSPEDVTETEVGTIDIAALNAEAKTYYDLIKTVVFATGSNNPQTRSQMSEEESLFVEKLEEMEILDDEGNILSFFDLPADEQVDFLGDWVICEAEQMTEKILIEPEIEDYIREQNEIIIDVLNEKSVQTRSGEYQIANSQQFFQKVRQRMDKLAEEGISEDKIQTRASLSSQGKISSSILKTKMQQSGRRGDFLVALPKHGAPWRFINFKNEQFTVGHAAVINKRINENTADREVFTWGCQVSDGVTEESVGYWSVKCYIMGVQKVSWKWRWRGFKSGLVRVTTHVSNPAALANRAQSYKGREYVKWYEFATAKWAAPSRFTCTTLVWYAAQKEYGINISNWFSPLVSPSGLYLDGSTYVRATVQ